VATVLLLRHGRTTANADGSLAGRTPVALDDKGVSQARAVGERLAGVPLRSIVSSPLVRCRQTLEEALPGVAPVIEPDLTECGYGDWEGKALKTLAKDPLWKVVQAHPSAVTFPGAEGESMAAMSARAVAAIRTHDERVTAGHGPDALWLACSHGDVIKAIIADALGIHLDLFQRIVVDPASVTVIRYTPGRPFVVRVNDTGGALAALVPPARPRRGLRGRRVANDSDAAVGGGAGPSGEERPASRDAGGPVTSGEGAGPVDSGPAAGPVAPGDGARPVAPGDGVGPVASGDGVGPSASGRGARAGSGARGASGASGSARRARGG
jgi:probable phosphomutase (TIGR03848 family)